MVEQRERESLLHGALLGNQQSPLSMVSASLNVSLEATRFLSSSRK